VTNEKQRTPIILIVDDDKQVLKSLKIWLKNEGFKPLTATTGDEALELVEEHSIEVALVDYRMCKEDGISVSQQLKEVDEMLKIIMLTGFPSYETAVTAMKVGLFDYISKGSSNEKILEAIHKAINEREIEISRSTAITPHPGNDIRLILFCNHSLLKERLENYSTTRPGFKLIKSFPSLDAIGVKNITQQIDIALLCGSCILKTVKDSNTALTELYRVFPEIKPVILNDNFSDLEKVELLKLGVRGFAPPDASAEKLEDVLLKVKKGEICVSRNVTNLSLQDMTSHTPSHMIKENEDHANVLTDREIEILRTMTRGLKNKEIAEKLFISEKTVKTHINHLFHKLGVDSRSKAVFRAIERKII
jgi:DNA-binding NarL/FixJ family response regulator